jgi:hypothetical protein
MEDILKKMGQTEAKSDDIFLPFCLVFILWFKRVKNTGRVNKMSSD